MFTTSTMFQAPNTVIYDGMPRHGYNGHYMEIVIAEKWGYRVVWCVEIYEDGTQHTHLYRLEKMRKLSDEDKKLVGVHWTAYGLYDVDSRLSAGITGIYYTKELAMLAFKEKVMIAEHNRGFTDLAHALDQELENSGIQYFYQHIYNYCSECACKELFNGSKVRMLHSLRSEKFTDVNGFSYGLWHEDSIQYESFPMDCHVDGVNCSECGTELIEPLEIYDEDETVTGCIAGDSLDNGDYDQSLPSDFDSQSF